MTRIRTSIAGLALAAALLCCPVGAAWADENLGSLPGSSTIPVTGTAERTNLYYEIVLGDADASSVALPGGVTLSGVSSSASDAGLHVAIVPVTQDAEPDAWAWLSGEAADLGEGIKAYYLAFYRDDERAQPAGAVSITLASTGIGQDSAAHFLGSDGQLDGLASLIGEGSISFGMGQEGYYLLSGIADEPDDPDKPGGGDDPNKPTPPGGDDDGGDDGNGSGDGGSGDNGNNGNGAGSGAGDGSGKGSGSGTGVGSGADDGSGDASSAKAATSKTSDAALYAAPVAAVVALVSLIIATALQRRRPQPRHAKK